MYIYIKHLLDTQNILLHTRYVDDILLIYDTTINRPHAINAHINQIHDNINPNPTYEINVYINFLDLTITRKQTKLETDIYHKPTTTDTTINFLSNHPIEYKMATFSYHISRMYTFPLAPEKN
jgi:hypothetical protein